MAYTPQTWVDGSAGGTPISAARLQTLESGLQSAAAAADSATTAAATAATKVGGVTVTGTPTTGQVPTAVSGTAATWQTPAAGGAPAAGVSPVASRLTAGNGYATPFLTGSISNQVLAEGEMALARLIAGRAFTAGALFSAAFYLATGGTAGSQFRTVLYKIDPATQVGITLLADFGQVDTSTGTGTKTTGTTALLADIAVGDTLGVGGIEQGAATTRAQVQCSGGFDGWFPLSPGQARPQGLSVTGVAGAPPASATATVRTTSATAVVPFIYITAAA